MQRRDQVFWLALAVVLGLATASVAGPGTSNYWRLFQGNGSHCRVSVTGPNTLSVLDEEPLSLGPGHSVTETTAPVVDGDGNVYIIGDQSSSPILFALSTSGDAFTELWHIELAPTIWRASSPVLDDDGHIFVSGTDTTFHDPILVRVTLSNQDVDSVRLHPEEGATHVAHNSPPVIDANDLVYVSTSAPSGSTGGGGAVACVDGNDMTLEWWWCVPRHQFTPMDPDDDQTYPCYASPLSYEPTSGGAGYLYGTAFYTNELGGGMSQDWKRVSVRFRLNVSASSHSVSWREEQVSNYSAMSWPYNWFVGSAPALASSDFYLVQEDSDAVYKVDKSDGSLDANISAPGDSTTYSNGAIVRSVAIMAGGEVVVGGNDVRVYSSSLSSLNRTTSVGGGRLATLDQGSTGRVFYTTGGAVGVIKTDGNTASTSNINAHEPVVLRSATRLVVGTSGGVALLSD